MVRGKYEVHEHSYTSGPNANICGRKVVHSHEGGNEPHQHEHTGPSAFTIDKDEWFRATGLKGGGRKKFTAAPVGPQLTIRDLEEWQKSFEIIVVGEPRTDVTGPGDAAAVRMIKTFGMRVSRVRGPKEAA